MKSSSSFDDDVKVWKLLEVMRRSSWEMTPEDFVLFDALLGAEFNPTAPWWGIACAMFCAKKGSTQSFLWKSGRTMLSFAYGYEFACAFRYEYTSTAFLADTARLRTPMGQLARHFNSAESSLPRTLLANKDPLWIIDFIEPSRLYHTEKLGTEHRESWNAKKTAAVVFFNALSLVHIRKKVSRAVDGLRINGSMRDSQHERLRLKWRKESRHFLNEHPRVLPRTYWKIADRVICA